jgi:outer membrane protein TolC
MKQLSQLAFCLSSKDPEWKEMTYQLEASKYKLEIANELPNPEFAWKFGYGSFLGDKIWQNELSISQTILIGGKRSAKYRVAETEMTALDLQSQLKKIEVLTNILRAFVRLKALDLEARLTKESVKSIDSSLKIYKSKPRLDPEQMTALYLLEMSLHQSESQVGILNYEKRNLLAQIKALSKKELTDIQIEKIVLSAKDPKFKNNFKLNNHAETLQKKLRQQELEYRKAMFDYEKANSWPDLKIGPMVNHQWQGSLEQIIYGFNLSFTFPLYNLNGAARANRRALYESYKNTKEVLDTQNEIELETRLQRYQEILDKYQQLPSVESVEAKVKNISQLLKRGVISVPSYMEVRRQTIDYIKSRQEMQLQLFELYLKLKNDLTPDAKFEIWDDTI